MAWFAAGVLLFLCGALVYLLLFERELPVPAKSLSPAPSTNFILISIDTLRADYVGVYGAEGTETPNLDALARDGTFFRRAVSEVPLTLPAHAALMTGTYPLTNGVRDNAGYRLGDDETTLAEALKRHGYATAAFPAAYVLHSKWGLNQGFDLYDDDFGPLAADQTGIESVERSGEEVALSALDWIRTQKGKPFFCWIHLFEPHDPYTPPEPFQSRYAGDPYAGEVAFADLLVGRIVEALREEGLYKESLIVVVGDHGESLGEHGEPTHGFFVYDSTLLVPFLIKLPQSRAEGALPEVAGPVQLVDVAPTALQVLGLPELENHQGRRLLGPILGKANLEDRPIYAESHYPRQFGWSELKAWRQGRYKYIQAPVQELYDLERDPGEGNSLFEQRKALAGRLSLELLSFLDRYRAREAEGKASTAVSLEDLERFRSLGYIGAPSRGVSHEKATLPDPKTKLDAYIQISRAMTFLSQGRFREAVPVLLALRRKEPGLSTVDSVLGQAYLQLRRYREAKGALVTALEKEPSSFSTRYHLAKAYFFLKELDSAARLFEQVVHEDPNFSPAWNYLGLLYSDRGMPKRAIVALSRAVEIQDDPSAYRMLGYLYTQQHRPDQAAAALEKAVALDPSDPLSHLYLANSYMVMGQRDQARTAIRKAYQLNPSLRQQVGDTFAPLNP